MILRIEVFRQNYRCRKYIAFKKGLSVNADFGP